MSAYVKAPRGRSPLDSIKPYQRSRFAAPYAQRSELKASVNNALLGLICPRLATLDIAARSHFADLFRRQPFVPKEVALQIIKANHTLRNTAT
jgi:hypothetical protein